MKALPVYKEALESSGHQLPSQPTQPITRNKCQRRRNIILFNPPFNQNVTTNVAGRFLKLISKHFSKHNKYYKLFNRMNVKVYYNCTKNMGAIIAAHNAKVLAPKPADSTPTRLCNCRRNTICPLNGKCLTECFVYKATVLAPGRPTMIYYGLTEGTFKSRYYNHTKSLKKEEYIKETE